ncbi:MAG: methyltransferase domain-containing protein [Stellaceae bacterium]
MVLPASFPGGLRAALRLVRDEIGVYKRHRNGKKNAAKYAGETNLKLNIGCGPNTKSDWINIDLISPRADLALDMREAIPFHENSAIIIYSEHFFEHLDYPDPAKRFLKECLRILQPGGTFSVGVPDTQWPLEAYVGPDEKDYFAYSKATYRPAWCETRLESINYHFRQDGEHRFAYDYETLHHVLIEAGFQNIRRRDFDSTLDTEDRRIGTLYVDAQK